MRTISKKRISNKECLKIKNIFISTGTPGFDHKEIDSLFKSAVSEMKNVRMKPDIKTLSGITARAS
jgi:hypothetical protein